MPHPLDSIFKPRSIAIIGASRRKDSLGYAIINNLIKSDFNGTIFPVNPKADVIHSLKCYPSIRSIPDRIDLAIIIVPKELVLPTIDECSEKQIKGIILITAGFKEIGGEGIVREKELVDRIKKYGMRMVGPNCMGVINTDPEIRMDATFSPVPALEGNIGFMSQSGALGVAILGFAKEINLGFSQFASVGNKANISGNDLLEYWSNDPRTDLILLYLESFGNPRKFTQLAREITKRKPILAVKAGRTAAGARAVSSHTGVLSGMDVAIDALLDQCGVIRVSTIEELFDLALAFTGQPVPKTNRMAIVTNAGGPGIMATDACVSLGLDLVELSGRTQKKLRSLLPEEASVKNPVDMIASANEESYRNTLEVVLRDEKVDSVLVIFVTPPALISPLKVARAILEVRDRFPEKTVLGCLMGKEEIMAGIQELKRHKIPMYTFPEGAAKALAALNKYRRWKDRPQGEIKKFKIDHSTVQQIIENAGKEKRANLDIQEVFEILEAYGFPLIGTRLIQKPEEAVALAKQWDTPVVLKVQSRQIIHKSDIGGVKTDLRTEKEIVEAFQTIVKNVKDHGHAYDGILVQEMVKGGKETILGMSVDPVFGPLLMFGLGGMYVEALKDVTFKIVPITDIDAKEMIEGLKSVSLLKGVRGEPAVDLEFIRENLQRLSQLVADFESIVELDINPFIFSHQRSKCKVVDARIKIKI